MLPIATAAKSCGRQGNTLLSLNQIKMTPRDQQVLPLLVRGCSNKDIAAYLNISTRTMKQHLRTLFLRAGIRDCRKRVKLATAMFAKEQMKSCKPRERLTPKEMQVAALVWEGQTNRNCKGHWHH